MKNHLLKICSLAVLLIAISCNKDDDNAEANEAPTYKIVNNGNGGVNTINDDQDYSELEVVQAVPAVQGTDYPQSIPVLLFFDDKIYLPSLENGIKVTQDGTIIGGTVYINEGANGYAIMTFVPKTPFTPGTTIIFELIGIQDDGGNEILNGSYQLSFSVNQIQGGNFDGNGSFNTTDGVLFLGDGAIMTGTQGCVVPVDGNSFAAITTGDQLISSGSAIGNASSIMILGAIEENISSLSFSYNFLSAEFDEYVDSQFDDSVIVTIVGPNNAHSEFLTSVNTVGTEGNNQCIGFPNMPDAGDDYAGATGWINKTIHFAGVGSPAYVIFTVTDVADTIYSSVLAVDQVTY